jgi:hypothetical protein
MGRNKMNQFLTATQAFEMIRNDVDKAIRPSSWDEGAFIIRTTGYEDQTLGSDGYFCSAYHGQDGAKSVEDFIKRVMDEGWIVTERPERT